MGKEIPEFEDLMISCIHLIGLNQLVCYHLEPNTEVFETIRSLKSSFFYTIVRLKSGH